MRFVPTRIHFNKKARRASHRPLLFTRAGHLDRVSLPVIGSSILRGGCWCCNRIGNLRRSRVIDGGRGGSCRSVGLGCITAIRLPLRRCDSFSSGHGKLRRNSSITGRGLCRRRCLDHDSLPRTTGGVSSWGGCPLLGWRAAQCDSRLLFCHHLHYPLHDRARRLRRGWRGLYKGLYGRKAWVVRLGGIRGRRRSRLYPAERRKVVPSSNLHSWRKVSRVAQGSGAGGSAAIRAHASLDEGRDISVNPGDGERQGGGQRCACPHRVRVFTAQTCGKAWENLKRCGRC